VIRELWLRLLQERSLPFDVHAETSERRSGRPGADQPDLALYDRGEFVAVVVEVKTPDVEIAEMAMSTERNDQVGRYLAQTGVVLLCNVRSTGLLACKPGFRRLPGQSVPPAQRELLESVDLWATEDAFKRGRPLTRDSLLALGELLERAVTEFAHIADPLSLARILARQARRAKADLPGQFDTVASLLDDYRKALGLTFDLQTEKGAEFFRSSLIQTAYYGLFAGWTLWHRAQDGTAFRWEHMDAYLKIPFLGKLFYEFKHPDRLAELRLGPHLDRAAETLGRVDRGTFFSRFSYSSLSEGAGADDARPAAALTYFYEPFLEAFDPDLRKELGVWYTPPEIVRYQVRKIDHLLRAELGCPRGFADSRVVVLDPCCGTAAYLLEVVRCIAADLRARGDDAVLGAEVLQAVSKRVIGFEILTAPFVIAQLQLFHLLSEVGAVPTASHRPAIFLTNALAGWEGPEPVKLNFPELQQEHAAARRVKRDAQIIVVLGNPPYNRFAGAAVDEEADLVDHYKGITRRGKAARKSGSTDTSMVQEGGSLLYSRWGIRKQLLDDLYIRFFRLAEKRIGERAEYGVVSFISNSSYLTGRSHPLMRESLLASFHEIWIDNTNGDKYRTGKVIPSGLPGAGSSDQSIFTTEHDARGIQVGTCISTFLKRKAAPTAPEHTPIHYRDFWGKADSKRRALIESLDMEGWDASRRAAASERPQGPRHYETILARDSARWMFAARDVNVGYEAWPALDELFPTSYQGVNPNRGIEGSVVDTDRSRLVSRMRAYFSASSFEEVRQRCPALAQRYASFEPNQTWKGLRTAGFDEQKVRPYQLFPLDCRWLYYETTKRLLNRPRPELAENLMDNEFLATVPQPRRASESRPILVSTLFDLHLHDRGSVGFPREIAPGTLLAGTANLNPAAWARLRAEWGLEATPGSPGAPGALVAHLFRAALVLLHAPTYQDEHQDALAQDWAHVPIPKDHKLFDRLAKLGDKLALLLDPMHDADAVIAATLGQAAPALGVVRNVAGTPISEDDLVVSVSYYGAARGRWIPRAWAEAETSHGAWGTSTGDLYISPTVYFANVPEAVWRYELGGYPVLRKWLGYRQAARRDGRPLTLAERRHFRSMIQRIAALLVLYQEADDLYEAAAASAFTAEELGVRK
jgi:hypothetical protein